MSALLCGVDMELLSKQIAEIHDYCYKGATPPAADCCPGLREALARTQAENERLKRPDQERELQELRAEVKWRRDAMERTRNGQEDLAIAGLRVAQASAERDAQQQRERAENAREQVAALTAALEGLLLSADAMWEEDGAGHDWRYACNEARKALVAARTKVRT